MKKYGSMVLAALLLLSLTACRKEVSQEKKAPLEESPIPQQVTYQGEISGQTLVMDAKITMPASLPTEKIILRYDDSSAQALFHTLISDPQNLHIVDRDGNFAGQIFSVNDNKYSPGGEIDPDDPNFYDFGQFGTVYYEDNRLNDIEKRPLDDPSVSDAPNSPTSQKPDKMKKTDLEAAQAFGAFLEDYSCLDFSPNRATAREGTNGAYYIQFLPYFDDMQILSRDLRPVSGQVSQSHIDAFQGTLLLKQSQRIPLESPIPFSQILERFQAEFADYTYAKELTIWEIKACYVAIPTKDSWTLNPAWAFLGSESEECVDSEFSNSKDNAMAVIYQIEDGFSETMDLHHMVSPSL